MQYFDTIWRQIVEAYLFVKINIRNMLKLHIRFSALIILSCFRIVHLPINTKCILRVVDSVNDAVSYNRLEETIRDTKGLAYHFNLEGSLDPKNTRWMLIYK